MRPKTYCQYNNGGGETLLCRNKKKTNTTILNTTKIQTPTKRIGLVAKTPETNKTKILKQPNKRIIIRLKKINRRKQRNHKHNQKTQLEVTEGTSIRPP